MNLYNKCVVIFNFIAAISCYYYDYTSDLFNEECLKTHNYLRRKHGSPDLLIDSNLVDYSRKRVYSIVVGDESTVERFELGENRVKWPATNVINCSLAVQLWYDQIEYGSNDLNSSKFEDDDNFYTQMLWKSMSFIGCAIGGKTRYEWVDIICAYSKYAQARDFYDEHANNITWIFDFEQPYTTTAATTTYIPITTSRKPTTTTTTTTTTPRPTVEPIFGLRINPYEIFTEPPKRRIKKPILKINYDENDLTDEYFNYECLESHNDYRLKHGVPRLTLNDEIIEFARQRARTLAKRDTPFDLIHDAQDYGENLASWSVDYRINCTKITKLWYDEIDLIKDWNDPNKWGLEVYHFTQVIWKDTKEIGCAIVRNKKKTWVYISCNYSPPGNYENRFLDNILR